LYVVIGISEVLPDWSRIVLIIQGVLIVGLVGTVVRLLIKLYKIRKNTVNPGTTEQAPSTGLLQTPLTGLVTL